MNKDAIYDELRRVELEVVESERRLAEQEALVMSLTQQGGESLSKARALLDALRANQQRRQQDRLRLLSLLQP